MKTRFRRQQRKGNVIVLASLMMAGMFVLLAFAVDLGYLTVAHTELQRTADSAAMAAAWNLVDDEALTGTPSLTDEIASARVTANYYGSQNKVCSSAPDVDGNSSNSTTGDVVVGYMSDPADKSCQMTFSNPQKYNSVQVTVRRNSTRNGEVPFFFARILGLQSTASQAQATAALLNNFAGFKAPESGDNLELLPFVLDKDTWDDMLAGGGSDNWTWNPSTGTITSGGDGVREVNLYPQGTGSPGNRGTVDIGGSNNSTNDIARQILDGVSAEDLSHFPNGEVKFDGNGELALNGDTGISAGVKDELASVKGQPRIIPIFESVSGPGNNATYVVVEWAGVRIMDVNLNGSMSSKRVIIQPARVFPKGGIPGGDTPTSHFVYSPVWLVR